MKKHFILIACALLSMSVFAQNKKTEPVSFTFEMNFESGYTVNVKVKTTAYYDENDKKIYHGSFTASGSENVNNNGVTGRFSYSASGTYKDGRLDGPIKITKNEYVANRSASAKIDASLSGAYKDGVPCGTWTISYGGSGTGEGKAMLNYTLTFKDGEVASVVNNDGVNVRLELVDGEGQNSRNFLISGTVGETTYKKGYNATDFKRMTNELSKLDDDAKVVLNDLIAGNITEDKLIDRGYKIDKVGSYISTTFKDLEQWLGRTNSWGGAYGLGLSVLDKGNGYRYHDSSKFETYYLSRVKLYTAEECLAQYGDLKQYGKDKLETFATQLTKNYIEEYYHNRLYMKSEEAAKLLDIVQAHLAVFERIETIEKSYKQARENLYDKYRRQSSLNDELNAYDELYYTYEIRNGKDTTVWKKAIEQAAVFDSLCQKLVSINEQTEQLLPQVKAFSPKLHKLYLTDIKNRTETCPQKEEKLKEYMSTVEGWRLENIVMIKLMEKVPQMEAASNELSSSANAEIAKAYKDAEKKIDLQLKDDYSEYGVNVINWMKVQAEYKELDQMYTSLREHEAKLNELLTDKSLGDVKKVYATYAKAHPAPLAGDFQTDKQEAQSVLKVLNDCEQFCQTRLKIAEQDKALTEQGKNLKNIAKEYAKYMKGANMVWSAENSADMTQLNAVLAVQSQIAAAYARPDAAELDNTVKKAKVKSLDDVLKLIK